MFFRGRNAEAARSNHSKNQNSEAQDGDDAADPKKQEEGQVPRKISPRPPRLVVRNLPFEQSKTTVQVHHNQGWKIGKLVQYDFFHILLSQPTVLSTGFLLFLWTLAIATFAGCYYAIDRQHADVYCGLGDLQTPIQPISYAGAFAFSLETCTTVGYGLPGPYNFFDNCPALQSTIYFQMVWSMMFNAFLFAFFFSRLARHDTRAVQVVFSKKAIVCIDPESNQVRFQVRVYDTDARHPVVEAHARLYAVRKDRPVPRPLRIIQPNDELHAQLFLSMPSIIHHHIDIYSLLHPVPQATDSDQDSSKNNMLVYPESAGLMLRQADSISRMREECECYICGEVFGTAQALKRHVHYQQKIETTDQFPVEGSHLSLDDKTLAQQEACTSSTTDLNKLRDYFERELSEVICVVEGIDPLMSGTFQALQSYCFEDIVWDEHSIFHPCLTAVAKNDWRGEHFQVDLDRFHEIDQILPVVPTDPLAAPSPADADTPEPLSSVLRDSTNTAPLQPTIGVLRNSDTLIFNHDRTKELMSSENNSADIRGLVIGQHHRRVRSNPLPEPSLFLFEAEHVGQNGQEAASGLG